MSHGLQLQCLWRIPAAAVRSGSLAGPGAEGGEGGHDQEDELWSRCCQIVGWNAVETPQVTVPLCCSSCTCACTCCSCSCTSSCSCFCSPCCCFYLLLLSADQNRHRAVQKCSPWVGGTGPFAAVALGGRPLVPGQRFAQRDLRTAGKGGVLAAEVVGVQGEGGVLAAEVVGVQSEGGVSAAEAVGVQGEGAVP